MEISIIIITKNGGYSSLDVPPSGLLYIEDQHLICGVTQNGVKMLMYGETSPLLPFETYIQNEALSLDIVGKQLYHPGDRLLDFTNIELLQTQFTINPADSGSAYEYQPMSFEREGYPVDYTLIIDGSNFSSYKQAQEVFRYGYNGTANGTNADPTAVINGLITQSNGMQKLSTPVLEKGFFKTWKNSVIRGIYDSKLTTVWHSFLNGFTSLEVFQGLEVTNWDQSAIGSGNNSLPNLRLIDCPKLTQFGNDPTTTGALYGANSYTTKLPLGVHIRVARAMETINGGAPDADLQAVIDNRQATVEYVD